MVIKRRVIRLGLFLAVLFALFPAGSAQAASGVNNFDVISFEADYYLTKDREDRSRLRVSEKIVVKFPPFDQNHGIERALPDRYDGHTVNLKIASVKDEKGNKLPFRTYGSNGNKVVRIGDPNKYAQGIQTYVINYDMRDVTKQFEDHDELYWDTNGTDWGQTFGSLTARLHLSGSVAEAFSGNMRCFEGSQGSTSSCKTDTVKKSNETIITFSSSRMLYAGENVTFVAGFAKDTFSQYQPTAWERWLPVVVAAWMGIGAMVLGAAAWVMTRAWRKYGRSPEGRGTIVPEYIPPKDLSVLASSAILKRKGSDITAQVIDLAVRHYLRVYETETKGSWFKNKRSYEIELIKLPSRLRSEERRLIEILFGDKPPVGQRITLEGIKSKLYKETTKLEKEVEAQIRITGYLADQSAARKKFYRSGGLVTALGAVTLNPGIFLAGLLVVIVAANFHPLTEKGVSSRDYLRGLEMYMKLAEAERIRVLQSPQGAVKTAINPNNKKRMVTLYERLLPYAIVFGLEKDWVKQFAPMYQQQPDWYVSNTGAFNAAAFASSLNSFSTVSNNTFAPPTSSSSSGFSGGASGGGGGGGGGGGW